MRHGDHRDLLDDSEFKLEQVRDLAEARQLVPRSECDVMRRTLSAPGVEEAGCAEAEADPRVRVADPEGGPGDRLAFSGDQLQPTVGGLRDAEDRHRPEPDLHLDRETRAGLSVVELERAGD